MVTKNNIMREFKFRVWFNKSMVYSDQMEEESNNWNISSLFEYYDCGHFMQFTGLKDQNGKEIYEGDIIEQDINGYKIKGVISFYDNGFWIKNPDNSLHLPHIKLIIGNIYENPELLT